jgi:hypothetical protein
MAKYVILAFDSDDEADKFVEETQAQQAVWVGGTDCPCYPDEGTELKCDVRGVFRKPTKFCSCTSVKSRGFSRGRKYGWWVCSQCGKPTVGWGRGDHWFLALGKNLLPISNVAPEYRGDGVFARHFKKCPVCDNTLVTEMGVGTTKVYCPQCNEWR